MPVLLSSNEVLILKEFILSTQESLHWMDTVIITLVSGVYLFCAGGYMFTWWLNRKVNAIEVQTVERFSEILKNHLKHLEDRILSLERTHKDDPAYLADCLTHEHNEAVL